MPLDATPDSTSQTRLMNTTRLLGGALGVSLVAALALTSTSARASGYLSARFGSDHGTPAAPNPFAVYFNPAAMGGMKGTEVVVDASIAIRDAKYTRTNDALTPSNPSLLNDPNYVRSNTGTARLLNVIPLPFLGFASDLGTKNLRVGAAVYVPFGGLAEWKKNDAWSGGQGAQIAPGAVDGVQRWHNISGQILAIYSTAAVAYRFEDVRITIGANVSFVHHQVSTVRARNADGSDDIRTPGGSLKEGRSWIDASGNNLSAALGVYWEPLEDHSLKLGLSYTSQPGFGDTRMSGELRQQFGTDANVAQATKVDFLQTYPDVIRLGGAYRLSPKVELRLDGEYARWSVFDRQCVVAAGADCDVDANGAQPPGGRVILNIPREWRDAFGVRGGGSFYVNDELELFASAAVTTSAVPKTTIDVSTIDSTRLYGTLGARYAFTHNFALAGSYNHIYFLPVDTKGENKHDTFASTSKSPSADGKYEATLYFVNVNATLAF